MSLISPDVPEGIRPESTSHICHLNLRTWTSGYRPPQLDHIHLPDTESLDLVYISGRPFVLRDASRPRRTLSMSDRAENLEAIEERLKNDILQEANK